MIRLLVTIVIVVALAYCGATVKLGKRTFFGHVSAIWSSEPVQDLKEGVEEKAGPALQRVKKEVHEATGDHNSATPAPAPAK
ncbi:MAG: hypothetical protein KF773_07475 [Deltaproteobacteria bacterium]|nr:hypothetical protein [Deltaproteobacteria bacterium]